MAGIQLKSVRKSYQGLEVMYGIDRDIVEGSFTVFVGPSGCGKPGLLRMKTGHQEISTSELLIAAEI